MSNQQRILDAKNSKSTSLELYSISEEDIEMLNNIASIERISLVEFSGDFSLLPRVPKLYSVALIDGCEPEDFQFLANVPTLRFLAINHWGPDDLSGIGHLKQLVELSLSENEQYTSIDFVESLTNLEVLDLEDGQFEDLSPIAGLKRLRKLNLVNCDKIVDLSPLAALTSLTVLDIRSTSATDLSPLENLTQLESLKLDGDIISTAPIESLKKLTLLEIAFCSTIEDFDFLSTLPHLTHLTLQSTLIHNLSPVSKLKELVSLSLDGSPVSDVSPLASLVGIESLNLQRTKVRNLAPLKNLKLSGDFYLDRDIEYLNNPKS
jgi:internalin A